MKLSPEELSRRREEGARMWTRLRQATRTWRAIGDRILKERRRGHGRSNERGPFVGSGSRRAGFRFAFYGGLVLAAYGEAR